MFLNNFYKTFDLFISTFIEIFLSREESSNLKKKYIYILLLKTQLVFTIQKKYFILFLSRNHTDAHVNKHIYTHVYLLNI